MNSVPRITALRDKLSGEDVAAAIISAPSNVAYITGFDSVFDGSDAHAVVVTADSARFYTDGRYAEAVTQAASGTEWEIVVVRENLYATVCEDLSSAGFETVAIEESVPYGRFRFVSQHFDGNVIVIDQWVEEIRQVKSPEEVKRIAAAQAIADEAFVTLLDLVRIGVSEREIALELEYTMRRKGADAVSFSPIIASGENSSRPHATVSDRKIQSGDFVKMDFGALVGGYCSDMTRTVVVGKASSRQREIYEGVLAANLAGIEAVAPGVPGKLIDQAARDALVARGLGELFTHSLGHGVGLDIHELPHVGQRGTKSVREGSVLTIEPGVYEPGLGGVRIEDLVVVESTGALVLSTSPKHLIEL